MATERKTMTSTRGHTGNDFEDARALLERPRSDLVWHHDLGVHLLALAPGGAVGVAGRLGVSPARVYQHQWFARTYTREQAGVLDGKRLPWSFLVALMGFRHTGERDRLLEQASAEGWSLARLRLEARARQPSRRRGAGRKRQRRAPEGAAIDLARLEGATRDWLELSSAALTSLEAGAVSRLRERQQGGDTPDLDARLRALADSLREAEMMIGVLRLRLGRLQGGCPAEG